MTRPKTRRAPRPLAILLTGLPLAACGADRAVTGSTYPHDYRQRHPIVLAEGPRTLDVFVNAAHGLDPRQREDVVAFAVEYRRYGQGPLVAQVPAGSGAEIASHRTLAAIRETLEAGGAPGGALVISTYLVADPRAASAIRLSFPRLKARVASRCGLWPQDLGVSDTKFNSRNEPYWNHGCAVRSNMAAQIADPVDLVRGRTETPPDTIRRTKVIDAIRQQQDPSTQYRQEGTKINKSVGN
jgi:pilus assembly protein CpaD